MICNEDVAAYARFAPPPTSVALFPQQKIRAGRLDGPGSIRPETALSAAGILHRRWMGAAVSVEARIIAFLEQAPQTAVLR